MMRKLALALCLALAAPAARAETTIRIGVLTDLSGVYADLAGRGSVVAAQLAAKDFEAENPGYRIEVLSADHQNKADVGVTITRSWYDQDKVDVIVDVPNSAVALGVSQLTREKNRIFLNSGAGTVDLTGPQCSPNTVHWTYDIWALANGTARALVRAGGDTWFFVAADYAFGRAMQRDASGVVASVGGTVLGTAYAPFPTMDFSSYLLRAQGSGAKVIGLANGGRDLINAVKQAKEFGVGQGGQQLAGLVVFISDVKAIGLRDAEGLTLTEAFYWNQNERTRDFAKRFAPLHGGAMPTMVHAGVYSSIRHYLKAVLATGGTEARGIAAKMRALPIDDPLFGRGEIRPDGRAIHDMYLFRVKAPAASQGPWDLYETVATIPAAEAFRPLGEGGCPLAR